MKRLLTGAMMLMSTAWSASAQELTYWSVWSEPEPQAQVLKQLFEEYSAAHPGVTITPVWIGRQNLVQLRSHLFAGNTADIVDGDARQYLGLALKEDFFVDLTGLAAELKDSVLPNTVSLMAENGIQYGIPYIHNAVVFLYNKDAFEEAGVTAAPKTLDELFAACKLLTAAEYDPVALEGNLDFFNFYFATYLLDQIAGPGFVRTLVEDKTGEAWRSPDVRRMLDLSKSFWDEGCIPEESKSYQWPTAQQNLAVVVAAMELVGSWVPTELAQATDENFRWGAFSFPTITDGANANSLNTAMMAIGVHKSSKNPEIATDAIRFLMSPESQQRMATDAAVGVVRTEPEWIPALAEVKAIVEAATGAIVEDNVSAYYPDYGANIMLPNFGKFFRGEVTADEYVETMVTLTKDYWANQ